MTGEHFRRLVFETVAFFFGDANRFLKTKPRYFLFIISPILILFTPLKKHYATMGSKQRTPRDGCRKWPKNSHFVLTTFLIDFLCAGLGGWHWKLSERVIHGFSRCTTEYGHHRSRSQCISEKWILLRCSCPNKRQWKPWRCKRIKEVTTIWTSNTCMNLNFLGYDLSSTDIDSCRYLWCTSFFFSLWWFVVENLG